MEAATGGQVFAQREITKTANFYPTHDKKKVHYMIIPNTVGESKKDDERPFFLRVFSSETIDLVELPPTIEQSFAGKWTDITAGGKRSIEGAENQKWCVNPQYFLNITVPTHIKIILRRKKGVKKPKSPLGICVTKANSPIEPPAAQMLKVGKDGKLPGAAQTVGPNGEQFEDTMKGAKDDKILGQTMLKRSKNEVEQHHFIPPKLDHMERKLQILPNEWYVESLYHSEDVAALYAFWQPTQGPFLIVPSLVLEGYMSEYTMTVFSSKPLEIQKLEDSRNAVLTSRWTEETAGGCHLYDTVFEKKEEKLSWKNNPKFHLRLHTTQKTEVKITLSRPEKAWKKKIAKSSVACMIGMYVYPYAENEVPHTQNVISSMKFAPFNQINEVSPFLTFRQQKWMEIPMDT